MSEAVFKPLTPDMIGDYLSFFDNDAFTDNPHWASCYCYYYHNDGTQTPWDERSASENRSAITRLILQRGLHGYLAYADDQVVGWVQAAPRFTLPNIRANPDLRDLGDGHPRGGGLIGSIACFMVRPDRRREGIGAGLLNAAVDGFKRLGLQYAEAYPRRNADSDASNYHGPLELYLRVGFEPVRELGNIVVVRKAL